MRNQELNCSPDLLEGWTLPIKTIPLLAHNSYPNSQLPNTLSTVQSEGARSCISSVLAQFNRLLSRTYLNYKHTYDNIYIYIHITYIYILHYICTLCTNITIYIYILYYIIILYYNYNIYIYVTTCVYIYMYIWLYIVISIIDDTILHFSGISHRDQRNWFSAQGPSSQTLGSLWPTWQPAVLTKRSATWGFIIKYYKWDDIYYEWNWSECHGITLNSMISMGYLLKK